MAEIALAKPTIRGNSDVIVNLKFNGTKTEAEAAVGKAGQLVDGDTIGLFNGEGIAYGVIGYVEADGRVAVIRTAERCGVVLAATTLNIAAGQQAYLTAGGTFTNVSTDNTAVNAVFREAGDGIDLKSGKKTAGLAAYIDFVGGF